MHRWAAVTLLSGLGLTAAIAAVRPSMDTPDGPTAVATIPARERFAAAAMRPAAPDRTVVLMLSDTAGGEPYAVVAIPLRSAMAREAMTLAALRLPLRPSDTVFDLAPVPALPGVAPVPPGEAIIGVASFYDFPQQTASGDAYDPAAFTAAAQTGIRDKFGGIGFGRDYRPSYALAEYNGRKVIVKFNDVGPLKPGRLFDLSRAAMAYLGGVRKGLLHDVRVTPLPVGQVYPAGPVSDEQLAALMGNATQTAAR